MRAYLTNLGKYNEGELVGRWLDLPISEEDYDKALKEIGIGRQYEEVFFTDYETDGIDLGLGEYETIERLNEIAEKLESDTMKAVAELYGIRDVLDTDEDDWWLMPEIETDYDLGYYWAEESGCYDLSKMGALANYIDYESFGRDYRFDTDGGFTSFGWLERH